MFEYLIPALYGLGFATLAGAHVYVTFLAYQYILAWKASRLLLWVLLTFLVPVVSTLYWLSVHWIETGIFWNWLTLACAVGVACIIAGMMCELLRYRIFG